MAAVSLDVVETPDILEGASQGGCRGGESGEYAKEEGRGGGEAEVKEKEKGCREIEQIEQKETGEKIGSSARSESG